MTVQHPLSGPALRDDITTFIRTILGTMHGNAVMSLATGITGHGKLRVDHHEWFAYPEQLEDMVEFAASRADRDVYLSPIIYGAARSTATKQIARTRTNAIGAQTVWMDSDTCPPEAFRVPPTVHVDTSPGHGHDYWVLERPVAAALAAEVAHRITTAHADQGCDPSGWSVNKVLRVPTTHTHPGKPVPISWEASGEVYDLATIAQAYADVEVREAVNGVEHPAEDLLSREQVAEVVGRIQKRQLIDLLTRKPKVGEDGNRSQHRYRLMCDLFREGYEPKVVASIVWYSPAGAKWREEDPRGPIGLWFEVNKAQAEIDLEKGRTAATAAPSTIPERPKIHDGPTLLLPTERRVFVERSDFTTLYSADAQRKTPVFNAPLHSINALTVLALAHGSTAVIPKPESPMPLNLFSITISRSSTGKTQAARIMEGYIEAMYESDVFVPVDSSKNALVEHLLERDASVALLRGDEAHGQFRVMENAQWAAGLRETWTDIYDGKVAGIGRVGQKDLRKRAFVAASMHLSGTPEDMFDTLTRSMFKSGYAARQIWVLGEEHEVTADTLRTKQGYAEHEWDALPSFVADRFRRGKAAVVRAARQQRVNLLMTNEALERFDAAKLAIHKHFEHTDDPEIFTPATRRMFDIVWKVAGLFALEAERHYITKDDVLIALGYAEVWLDTLVTVSRRISSTMFSKACDEIERYVASREGREAPLSAIFARFNGERTKFVEEYVDSLIKQHRLFEPYAKEGGERKVRIKGDRK